MKKYIIYPQDPKSCPKLPDSSLLKATECKEGWFILIEHKDYVPSDWPKGTEVKEITPIEITE